MSCVMFLKSCSVAPGRSDCRHVISITVKQNSKYTEAERDWSCGGLEIMEETHLAEQRHIFDYWIYRESVVGLHLTLRAILFSPTVQRNMHTCSVFKGLTCYIFLVRTS